MIDPDLGPFLLVYFVTCLAVIALLLINDAIETRAGFAAAAIVTTVLGIIYVWVMFE